MVVVPRQFSPLTSTLTVTRTHKKRLLLASLLIVIASAIAVSYQFFTPEERLRREMVAYVRSISREDPRPDLVSNLSPDSIPILLKWIRQTDAHPTMRDRVADLIHQTTRGNINVDSSQRYSDYPPILAYYGFDFLGTNAAAAVPDLAQIARSPGGEDAIHALVAIGEPSLDAAGKLSRDSDPNTRTLAAFLVGSIAENHDPSVAILLPLLDDPDAGVRSEAYGAMAEFPGADTEQLLLPRLSDLARNLSENPLPTAAYALHTGSTNALVHLIEACIQSTNIQVRALLLAALAARDSEHDPARENLRSYGARRGNYYRYLERFTADPPEPAFDHRLHLIRSNILATGLPEVDKHLRPSASTQ